VKREEKMKGFKRNAVIVTVLLFVCAAVYLNWSYNKKEKSGVAADEAMNKAASAAESESSSSQASADAEGGAQDAAGADGETGGLYYTGGDTETGTSEYFAEARLERKNARDEAAATLQTVAGTTGASQETIDGALGQMTQIAKWTEEEAEVENLVKSKGFTDCVVYMTEDSVSVTVAAQEGLSNAGVAKITDIVNSETGYTPDQLKIIEIK